MDVRAAALHSTLMRYTVLALSFAVLAAGCDDPTAASKGNFARALTAAYDRLRRFTRAPMRAIGQPSPLTRVRQRSRRLKPSPASR